MWFVYILQCHDNSYYTGMTSDIKDRIIRHNQGRGPEYTKLRRPVKLIYLEECDSQEKALKRELEIKKFSRANKERLMKFGLGKRFPSAPQKN